MGVITTTILVAGTMQKAKSPSPAQRIFPKRWRRSKLGGSSSSSSSSPGGKPTSSKWKPQGGCIWSNLSGRRAMVPGTSLLQLSQIERLLLQKIALAKLQAMQLGCSISIPKDGASKRSKKPFSLKRKTNSEPSGSGWVFGIPLSKSVSNDEELRRRRPSQLKERRDSLDISHAIVRKSSSSSVSYGRSHSAECGGQDRTNLEVQSVERPVSFHAGAVSSDSLSETDTRSAASNLLDALSLSASSKLESSWREQKESLCPRAPQVPFIVKSCCQHLETYGLQVLGIFRIGCSKKRIRQLREEFDSGKDVKLNDEYNPHDVGGLLKEFFRDLPDPLLCRDLYSTFVATRKIADLDKRLHALRCLVALLPAANQDTLWTLVKFLALVTKHSTDSVDAEGNTIAGNKMDSHNLATLFAPSILHKAKGREFEVESVERARERREVIAVVKEIIDHHNHIFMLPSEMHDEILRVLHETNFEAADYILKRMPSSLGIDVDPETSSSFYEESDSSSIPRSPSSETECPRNITEALALRDRLAQKPAEPSLETLKVPQFRIISPDQGWYQPERSPSPVSPRISPSPKAMKQLSQPSPGSNPSPEHSPSSPAVLITPRPVRFRRTPMQTVVKAPSVRSSSIPIRDSRTLTVPTSMAERRGSDSSSSSYYPFSSRSPSHSPLSHDPPPSPNPSPRWYPETPPTTPSKEKDFKQLISSTHRPLGVTPPSHASEDHNSASGHLQVWQKERWKHWEKVAKERSSEFVEQETLV